MRREVLDHLLQALAQVVGERELVMVGSQTLHATITEPLIEVVMSRECDLLLDEEDPLTSAIDESVGPDSAYAAETAVYVDTVSATFPFLPAGWEQRLVGFPGAGQIRCLEIHDLVLSKLTAGRLKDYELIAVLLQRGLAEIATVHARIAEVADLHMRAILLARLQIVIESASR
jgi:hypothetical protein